MEVAMVYRCYTAKKKEYAVEAESALKDIRNNLGVTAAETLTIFNRYDVEGITPEIYERAKYVMNYLLSLNVDGEVIKLAIADRNLDKSYQIIKDNPNINVEEFIKELGI